ncbi:retrovirus-related pol polyprotein from transposon TNT 1-94 [Tanacetum coccineum]
MTPHRPTNEQGQTQNENVLTRGMYRITKTETQTLDSKTNIYVSNYTGVESSNSVRRQKSKDTKSKNRVLKNTKAKSSTTHVQKVSRSVSIDSNQCETMNSTLCHADKSVLNTKNVNDGLNIVCVSCGKDVFLLSHEKCVSRYALSRNSNVKRALFTTPLVLWIIDSGCSKHMTSNLQLLRYLVEKFMGTIHFGNDHFTTITGYGDYVQGNLMICHVYSVEGLEHNLFLVRQFYDGDLKVDFHSNTCYGQILESDDLLTGSHNSNLYTISIFEMVASSPIYLMSRATSTKSWLWHRMLSYLYFGTINQLTSKDLVDGLPKFKYNKDHLCSACEQGKSKKVLLTPKLVPSIESKVELLHMDLYGPVRVISINGKKYILVIVDDYSRYTWVYFLRTKDEAPDMIIDFVNQVQRNLKAQILTIQTDNGTEFKNEKLLAFYAKLGIVHQTSIAQMTQQNGVVERQNRTLVEAARTMLIFSKALEFLWAEAIATACFTQNRSIVHTRYNKTPYELIRGRKPNIQYFHVFGSLCYPTNDRDDLGKMKSKADIGIFIGYSESSRGFQYYATSSQEVSDNSAANTLDNEHTSSSLPIIIEEGEAPQIVSSSAEQVSTELNSSVLNENADEFVQEDVADFDGIVFYNAPPTPVFEEPESYSTYQDPSNMHEFHQNHCSSDSNSNSCRDVAVLTARGTTFGSSFELEMVSAVDLNREARINLERKAFVSYVLLSEHLCLKPDYSLMLANSWFLFATIELCWVLVMNPCHLATFSLGESDVTLALALFREGPE